MDRYARQHILPMVGGSGQERLRNSSALVVGAGALGCPVLQYLAGAGVGHITIVDPDTISLDNLHRQPLYDELNVGKYKALVAAERIAATNSDIAIVPHIKALNPANAINWAAGADIVLDCADSFAVTYTLSDVCFHQRKAYIYASVLGLTGYVGGFCHSAPSVRAIFPELPQQFASCASAGVLGPVAATLGSIQAQMALAYLLELNPSPLGQMVVVDFATYGFRSFRFDDAPEPPGQVFSFIAPSELQPDDLIIDLRSEGDLEGYSLPNARYCRTPSDIVCLLGNPLRDQRLVLCCKQGVRAWRAALLAQSRWRGPIVLMALNHHV